MFCFARFDPVFNILKNILNLDGVICCVSPFQMGATYCLGHPTFVAGIGVRLKKKKKSKVELYGPTLNISILSDRSSGVYALWKVSSFPTPSQALPVPPTREPGFLFHEHQLMLSEASSPTVPSLETGFPYPASALTMGTPVPGHP